jgi:S-DNA-T family DNA segregation ATPase FtsK/SpoIIIE
VTAVDTTKHEPDQPERPSMLTLLTGERKPVEIDTTKPIRPEWAKDQATARSTARLFLYRNLYRAKKQVLYTPAYVALLLAYSPRGLARLVALLAKYLYDYDSAAVRHAHAGNVETPEYVKAQAVRKANLKARGMVAGTAIVLVATPALAWMAPHVLSAVAGAAFAIWIIKLIPGRSIWEVLVGLAAGLAIWRFLPNALAMIPPPPVWPFLVAAVLAVFALGWHGRPKGKKIVKSTSLAVANVVESLRAPVVLEALCELGNSKMKEPDQIRLLSDPVRAGAGYQMDLELPRGVPAAYVVGKRDAFASGIRRELGCVFLSVGPRHPGHLVVFVSDMPMAKTPQAPWPLLKNGKVDIFTPVPMFTDQRGEWVTMTFAYASLVIGALPRMGKTFLLRQGLLVAALDPRVRVYALDGKGTGDLASLEQVAHFYSRGAKPEEIDRVRAAVKELRAELLKRADVINGLTREECRESKVTSALVTKRRDLCPIIVGIDETQSYFEYGDEGNKEHKKIRQELAAGITELVKLGPALGIIVILASQNVTATTIPRPISTNAPYRACLKVADQIANDQILGTSAYSQGLDATQLDYEDNGVLYLRADGTGTRVVRTVAGLDAPVAESIAARARSYRDEAGLLTGDAAGEDGVEEKFEVDLLADCCDVMDHPTVTRMHLAPLLERLVLLRPGIWGHLDVEALGSMLRAAGVPTGQVKVDGRNTTGVKREDLDVMVDDEDGGDDEDGVVVPLR